MNALELRIPPVGLTFLFAIAMAALAWFVPASIPIPAPFSLLLALTLAAAGGVVALLGVAAFRQRRTTVNPFTPDRASTLVATGIYRLSRNPMYLVLLLILAGWAAWLAHWVAALMLPAFVAYMNRFQIGPEERALKATFGDEFDAYARAVRRWL